MQIVSPETLLLNDIPAFGDTSQAQSIEYVISVAV
jgi:hypothetical protein